MNNSKHSEKKALLTSDAFFLKIMTIVAFIILVLIGWSLFNQPYFQLIITDMKSNEVLWKSDISKGDTFSHQYIHSVEKSPVKEVFQFSASGKLLTMESWTKSFGAGLPYQREGDVSMRDGYYVLQNLNRPIHGGVLRMKPSDLYPHTFTFQDQTFHLSEKPFVKRIIEINVSILVEESKFVLI